jgi:outer membrane protein TolC
MMVAARRRVELLTELEALLQDAVRVNQSLEEAAEVDRGTVLQAQLEKGQVVASKRQAEADLRARSAALAATLGVDVPFIAGIASDPWPEPRTLMSSSDSGSLDLMVGEPYLASPELTEAHALIEAARCELRLAETQIISNVDSYASVQQDTSTNDTIVSMQIGMALPVHDRKTGLVRAARAELTKLESEFARRERDLAARWAAATGEYQSAWELVRAIEEELLTTAQQRYELARRAQQQGEINYLELLLAQRSFLAVREAALEARQQAAIAAVQLEALVVQDSP